MAARISKRKRSLQAKTIVVAPAWYQRDWLILLLLALTTLAVFAPACVNEFLYWDDNLNIWKNPSFNPPTVASVMAFWTGPFLDLYVPITYTVWGILSALARMPAPDARGCQIDPFIFHTTNVLVHITSALLVYAILNRLFKKKWPAAAGALLFSLHPLQVEPVAWVTGLKDVLSGAFSLAALWQYVSYAQAGQDRVTAGRLWRHYALAMLFFVLAVLSKPSAVTVPALALVLDLLLIRKSSKAVVDLSPMFLLAGVTVVMSIRFQTVIAPADAGHVLLRPLVAADTLAFYLYKLVFPWSLGVQYNRAPLVVIQAGWLYFTWIAPAAVLVTAGIFRRVAPWALAAVAIFALAIAPVSGIVPFSFQQYATVADRYVYVAMLGPALALAAILAASEAVRSDGKRLLVPINSGVAAGLAGVLIILSVRSFAQTLVWRNNVTVFQNALVVNPRSALAYNYLAGELALSASSDNSPEAAVDRLARAKSLAERAVELAPNHPDGYLTLGSVCNILSAIKAVGGKPDPEMTSEALAAFAQAAEVGPTKAEALDSYGGALAAQGDPSNFPKAEHLLHRAIQINPRLAKAHLNLGVLLTTQRGPGDAQAFAEVEESVRLDPGDADAQMDMARLFAARHDAQHAAEHLAVVLQIQPNNQLARQFFDQMNRLRNR